MPENLTAAELAAIEAREKAATPGPWSTQKPPYEDGWAQGIVIGGTVGRQTIYGPLGGSYPAGDQKFIAEARTDVPALVATVRNFAKLLRGTLKHLDTCNLIIYGPRYSQKNYCSCGADERQAAIAHYDTAKENQKP